MTNVKDNAPHAAAKPGLIWGYIAAASGAALFATKAIFVKLAYRHGIDAEALLALRMILSAPVFAAAGLWAWLRDKRKATPRALLAASGVGVLGYYGASWFDFYGLEYISANLERVLLLTYPMFVIFIGALFFKTPLRMYAVGAALLSYVGIAILLLFGAEVRQNGGHVLLGASLVLISGLFYALYQLFAKARISALGGMLFTAVAMLAASVCILVHFALTQPFSHLAVSAAVLRISVGLAVFATILPAFLISAAIKWAGSQATAIIGTLSPLITIALSVAILGEHFGWIEAFGSSLVVGAVAFFTIWDMREQKRLREPR